MHRSKQDLAKQSRQSSGFERSVESPLKTRVLMVTTSMVQPESVVPQTLTLNDSMQIALTYCRQRKRGRHRRGPK